MEHQDWIGCTLKRLPEAHHVAAARAAIAINPANAPLAVGLSLLEPAHLALLTAKYWGAKGVRLTVGFLDTSDAGLKGLILAHMNAWGSRCNVAFTESRSSPQVRIARTPGDGYWSYLGTDILQVPAGQPTMNLDSFTTSTPASEYHRVVRHETGHTLGFPHEHVRAAIVRRLDPAKTIAYFQRTQGWSEAEVRAQVLEPLDESQLQANAADVVSIMCYQLPAEITVDGQPIAGGTDIDASDFELAARLYPQVVLPPPPPPPPPSGGPTLAQARAAVDAALAAVSRQQRPVCRGAVQAAQIAADAALLKVFGS